MNQNTSPVLVSVLIKTFNEENKICACIAAAKRALAGLAAPSEIIVADSLSTDGTATLARSLGVAVVQLCNPDDRGCGAGVQLGYQHSVGKYVYLLDGDMEVQADFIQQAIEALEGDGTLGGVGGLLEDRQLVNVFDRDRLRKRPSGRGGDVEWLSGGGVFRRQAIDDVGGYAANRNLKAYEEAELGLRLRSRGWKMRRLPVPAVLHTGHSESSLALIRRHWRSGRFNSSGVLLKQSFGKPWFSRAVRLFIHPIATIVFWVVIAGLILVQGISSQVLAMFLGGMVLCIALAVKKRSIADALINVGLWHVSALGLLRGIIFSRTVRPDQPLASVRLA